MKHLACVLLCGILILAGCSPKLKSVAPAQRHVRSETFIDTEQKKIEEHAKILVQMGHMSTSEVGGAFSSLGRYAWHDDGDGYFGAYSFYEPAFEQAKRAWFLHGTVLEGSNELWPEDDWDTPNQRHEIKFDESIIGYQLPPMAMSWFENGKYTSAYFAAKIVGIKENGQTLVLDKRAPHHAEQWRMIIKPADWVDMCACE